MNTSENDKVYATRKYELPYSNRNITLQIPSILVIDTEVMGVFLGVYGGEIAPKDFVEYMGKLLEEAREEFLELFQDIEAPSWIRGINLFFSTVYGVMTKSVKSDKLLPKSLGTIASIFLKQNKDDNNYFTLVDEKDAIIIIP